MKQAIVCLTFGTLLFSACHSDAVRQTENGIIVPITSGETKAVKLEVITDDVIRVMASPTGIFEESANLIKDTRQLLSLRLRSPGAEIPSRLEQLLYRLVYYREQVKSGSRIKQGT